MVLMTPAEYAELKDKGMESFPASWTGHLGKGDAKDDERIRQLRNLAVKEFDTHPHVKETRKVCKPGKGEAAC